MKKLKNKIILCSIMLITILFTQHISLAVTNDSTEKLDDNELKEFSELFNSITFNGFLRSEYNKTSEMDLNFAFRECGSENNITEEEKQDLLKLWNCTSFEIPVFKLTSNEIKDLYKKRTGEDINNIKDRLTEWDYLKEYDSYYNMHSDGTYQETKAISGEKTSDGLYKIIYKANNGVDGEKSDWVLLHTEKSGKIETTISKQMIATLKKVDNNYIIISNKMYTEPKEEETPKQKLETSKNNIVDDNINEEDTSIKKTVLPKAGKESSIVIVMLLISIIILRVILLRYKDVK